MKSRTKTAIALAAVAILGGCASGGGGGGRGSEAPAIPAPVLRSNEPEMRCIALLFCQYATKEDEQKAALIKAGLLPKYLSTFISWAWLPPMPGPYYDLEVEYDFEHIRQGHTFYGVQGLITGTAYASDVVYDTKYGPIYDANRKLHSIFSFSKFDQLNTFGTLATIGQPGIDVIYKAVSPETVKWTAIPFLSNGAVQMAIAANPYALGWNYQSFAVWNSWAYGTEFSTFGAPTPGDSIPRNGSAKLGGKLGGLYVSPTGQGSTATADIVVDANFSSRSLSFASTNTTLTRDLSTGTAAPSLNLSGTLTYSAPPFSGTITNAGGTLSGSTTGRFYGPAAQELGGIFSLKSLTSVETFIGGYGAQPWADTQASQVSPCGWANGIPVECVANVPPAPGNGESMTGSTTISTASTTSITPTTSSTSTASTASTTGSEVPTDSLSNTLRASAQPFSSWQDLGAYTTQGAPALLTTVYYGVSPVVVLSTIDPEESMLSVPPFDAQGAALPSNWFFENAPQNLARVGQPGIDIGLSPDSTGGTPYLNESARHLRLFANPYVLGWNFQSFGVWEGAGEVYGRQITVTSFGAPTPASAIPTSGSATFSGKLAGLYMSAAEQGTIAAAELSVNANFGTRSLSFASTGTTVTRDLATATAAPNLNLSGTLTYAPGSNSFSGTLTNAGGTMSGASNGRFYGPAAQELGGVLTLKSPTSAESFVGAYGAKR